MWVLCALALAAPCSLPADPTAVDRAAIVQDKTDGKIDNLRGEVSTRSAGIHRRVDDVAQGQASIGSKLDTLIQLKDKP